MPSCSGKGRHAAFPILHFFCHFFLHLSKPPEGARLRTRRQFRRLLHVCDRPGGHRSPPLYFDYFSRLKFLKFIFRNAVVVKNVNDANRQPFGASKAHHTSGQVITASWKPVAQNDQGAKSFRPSSSVSVFLSYDEHQRRLTSSHQPPKQT